MPVRPPHHDTPPVRAGAPWLWLLTMTAGIVAVAGAAWFGSPRAAGYVLGLILTLLGAARLALPQRLLPGLAVRTPVIDAALCLGLAGLVVLVSMLLP